MIETLTVGVLLYALFIGAIAPLLLLVWIDGQVRAWRERRKGRR